MKKIVIVLTLFIVAGLSAPAFSQAQFALGIKAGPNFAKIDRSSTIGENYKNRTGFHGGAFALIKIASFGIQPEVIFSQQGSTVTYNSKDLETNFNYINVPIIMKLYLPLGLNLQAGPQFGFLSKAEAETVISGAVQNMDVKSAYKDSDFSVGLGAGWDLPFGLTIDARYNLGITRINKETSSSSPEAKNQVFQASVGYKLIKFGK